jgi:hypothetical protein
MSTSPEILAARKLNVTRYALQDFDEAVTDFNRAAWLFGALVLAMGLSMIFGANNLMHLLLSLVVVVVVLLVALPRVEFLRSTNLIVLTVAYLALLAFEMMTFGLPDLLVPFLNAREWSGFPVFVNELTPYIYYGVKIAAAGYLARIWYQRRKVGMCPVEDMRKVAPERCQALGLV